MTLIEMTKNRFHNHDFRQHWAGFFLPLAEANLFADQADFHLRDPKHVKWEWGT